MSRNVKRGKRVRQVEGKGTLSNFLYLTDRESRRAIALDIHNVLQSAANDLERKKIEVQIVCKGRLTLGAALWLEYRGVQLPIDFIFGTPIKKKKSVDFRLIQPSQFQNVPFCPISVSGEDLSPRNTTCIPVA